MTCSRLPTTRALYTWGNERGWVSSLLSISKPWLPTCGWGGGEWDGHVVGWLAGWLGTTAEGECSEAPEFHALKFKVLPCR